MIADQSLKIVLTADPELPVPPKHYGGIERIIDMLARAYVARGHEVTLFANPESLTTGRLIPWPGRSSISKVDTMRNAQVLFRHVSSGDFDIVHSFGRVASLAPILPLSIPKIMTYQRAVTKRTVRLGHKLARGTLSFTAVSDWMMADVKDIGNWHSVPNGVPLANYEFSPTVVEDAPLVFLGRIEEIKGPHLAIEIAQRTGHNLIIAGNIPEDKRGFFEAKVRPHVDGKQISYIGPLDDKQKNALLGEAKAFLMPILWDEPFGIVMAEALACGTPVLGLNRGAVPEVVDEGVTGFIRDNLDDLAACVEALPMLDRAACRAVVEARYSDRAVSEAFLELYRAKISGNCR